MLLETFVKDRAIRSTSTAGEESIQSIVELLLSEAPKVVAEMCLVVDGSKRHGDGRFGFVDIFLPPNSASANTDNIASVLELKNLHLEGLLKGRAGSWIFKPPFKEMEDLAECLDKEVDDDLLARKYMYYSSEKKQPVITTVGEIIEGGLEQLKRYMETIAKGHVLTYADSGIFDKRVSVRSGTCILAGYVIMVIGGKRVLWRTAEKITAKYLYNSSDEKWF